MATRKATPSSASLNIAGVDLQEFKRQKDLITKAATAEVASRIDQIEVLMREIHTIVKDTGIEVKIYDLKNTFENIASEIDDAWHSSSYSC